MATTDVTICNSALIKLGAERITSLSDDSKEAQLCNEQYAKIRDALIYGHPWNFATRSAVLTSNGTEHAWNGYQQYDLPTGFLRLINLEDEFVLWAVEEDKLYCDDTTVNARYIVQITDPTKFSVAFTELLSAKLALELSYSLVQSASLKETLKADYQVALRDARSFDSQEGSPGTLNSSLWESTRR